MTTAQQWGPWAGDWVCWHGCVKHLPNVQVQCGAETLGVFEKDWSQGRLRWSQPTVFIDHNARIGFAVLHICPRPETI